MRFLKGLFLGLLAACSVLAASGCRSSAESDSSAELSLLTQFEAQAVQRFCAKVSACCSELSYPFDEAGCEALNGNNIVQFFNFEYFPGAHYDPAAGTRCLDGIETPLLGCSSKGDYKSADCKQVFVGSVPLGGTCSPHEGCATSDTARTLCDYPVQSNSEYPDPDRTGVCVLAPPPITGPHGKAGEACGSTCTDGGLCATLCAFGQPCPTDLPACYVADGLVCSAANICVPQGAAGEACMGSFDCSAGTYCGMDTLRCEPLLHAGDACEHGFQCETEYCSGTCTAPPRAYPEFCLGHIPPPPPP